MGVMGRIGRDCNAGFSAQSHFCVVDLMIQYHCDIDTMGHA